MKTTIDLKDLERLGVTEREARIYVALVTHGPLVPKQISAATSIPQVKIYRILHRLQGRGLLTAHTIKVKKRYEALRPDDVVRSLLMQSEQQVEAQRQVGSRLEAQMMSIFNEVRGTPSAQSYFTFLQNPAQIIRTLEEVQNNTHTESLWLVKGPYVSMTNEAGRAALRRGVRYRTIYQADELQDHQEYVREILSWVEAGEEPRVSARLGIKLAIFDCQVSLFQFVDAQLPEHRTIVLIRNEGVAESFADCFEYQWQKSVPIMDFLRSLPTYAHAEDVKP
jgi:sugar-specific transcriptional regulator TrmB